MEMRPHLNFVHLHAFTLLSTIYAHYSQLVKSALSNETSSMHEPLHLCAKVTCGNRHARILSQPVTNMGVCIELTAESCTNTVEGLIE